MKSLGKYRRAQRLASLEDARGILTRYAGLAEAGGVGDQLYITIAQNLVSCSDHVGRGQQRVKMRDPQLDRIKASRRNIVDHLRKARAELRPVKRFDRSAVICHPVGVIGVAQRAPDIVGGHEGPLHRFFLFDFVGYFNT